MPENIQSPMRFKGHSHIKIDGHAGVPTSGWRLVLYTDPEFNALSQREKTGVVPMHEGHRKLVEQHFGKDNSYYLT